MKHIKNLIDGAEETVKFLREHGHQGTAASLELLVSRAKDETDVPNLDAMDVDDLRDFLSCPLMANSYILRSYTHHKIIAMEMRLKGSIADALRQEEMCDNIYKSLPPEMRW